MGRPTGGGPAQRLSAEGARFVHSSPDEVRRKWKLGPGSFAADRGRVFLKLDPGQQPPDRATLAVYAGRRGRAGGSWRVAGGRFSGDGFSIWSGEAVELTLDLPPASALRFATAIEPALSKQGNQSQPVIFRVTLDGELMFQHQEIDPALTRSAWHEIALPPEGRPGSRIRFETGGALAYSSFLAPVIGPAEAEGRKDEIKKSIQEESDEECPKCGRKMIKKYGRNGPFLACPGYPDCRSTKPLEEEVQSEETCDKCGASMVVKRSKFGRFLACSRYPECKNALPLKIGVECPKEGCDGDIVEICVIWGRDPDAWSWAVGVEIAGKFFAAEDHDGTFSQSEGVIEVITTSDGRVCMKVLCPDYEQGGQWSVVTFYTRSEGDAGRTGDSATCTGSAAKRRAGAGSEGHRQLASL